ncbi:folate-binding protein [Salinibacterium sp. SYSU T00001]|uniref:CAF17-like 4Fe-4S cluster assembly/insertion protein YgfZ n=1 Tax=Homoserinimonas sedimenticola TaxID=2986805 RepID=UPI0022354FE3|nr:glycine cleavage T C-terminal barrel domain-containing protein [Salinibacterium sedimenticola]MCW4386125.1 folate-binding protein [Salinibacterium sedimenticola]
MSTDAPAYRSPWLKRPGAVEAEGADAGVAAHYGDPAREQRELEAGRALVDLSHRGVVTLSGPDRLTWLDSISSQAIAALQPGDSAETLILDPHGHIEHAARLIDDGESTWLLLDAAQVEPLMAWLLRMRFMMRVEIDDRSADVATLGLLAEPGTLGVEPAMGAGLPLVWRDPWPSVVSGGWQYAGDEHPAGSFDYREVLVPRSALAATDAPAAGVLALEALRIAAWRPRFANEVDERSIPHELDWLRTAVHLSKGCYRGQETVAKVHNLGHPPRRLVMLHLDGSDAILPRRGDAVMLDDRAIGEVTSVGRHHELGPVALAVVKRSADPAATLTVVTEEGSVAAGQEVIVPPGAGATAQVQRVPRLGAATRPSRPTA